MLPLRAGPFFLADGVCPSETSEPIVSLLRALSWLNCLSKVYGWELFFPFGLLEVPSVVSMCDELLEPFGANDP